VKTKSITCFFLPFFSPQDIISENMQQRVTVVALCLACLVAALCLRDVTAEYGEMLAPPPRPAEFTSADQLRTYLAQLNEYYSIMGRPRFGKRSSVFRKRFASLDAPVEGSWEDFRQ